MMKVNSRLTILFFDYFGQIGEHLKDFGIGGLEWSHVRDYRGYMLSGLRRYWQKKRRDFIDDFSPDFKLSLQSLKHHDNIADLFVEHASEKVTLDLVESLLEERLELLEGVREELFYVLYSHSKLTYDIFVEFLEHESGCFYSMDRVFMQQIASYQLKHLKPLCPKLAIACKTKDFDEFEDFDYFDSIINSPELLKMTLIEVENNPKVKLKRVDYFRNCKNLAELLVTACLHEIAENEDQENFLHVLDGFKETTLKKVYHIVCREHERFAALLAKKLNISQLHVLMEFINESRKISFENGNYGGDDHCSSPDEKSGTLDVQKIKKLVKGLSQEEVEGFFKDILSAGIAGVKNTVYLIQHALGMEDPSLITKIDLKRNQVSLKAYALLPMDTLTEKQRNAEIIRRYGAIQEFKRSSKGGMTAKMNESGAVKSALSNLAQVAGFPSVTCLSWIAESSIADDFILKEQFEEGDYAVDYDATRNTALIIYKNGKLLKSVPAALKKKGRFKAVFEESKEINKYMQRLSKQVDSLISTGEPVPAMAFVSLRQSALTGSYMSRIFLKSETRDFGVLNQKGQLETIEGEFVTSGNYQLAHPIELQVEDKLRLAWSMLKGVQPVKQLYREYYRMTDEEGQKTRLDRYKGVKLDGSIMKNLLIRRGWMMLNLGHGFDLIKKFGEYSALIEIENQGHYLGETGREKMGDVILTKNDVEVKAFEIPERHISEILRDTDFFCAVAGTVC